MKITEFISESAAVKQRLDPSCWTGKKIGNPKTKVKGGVRVNNCVPAESIDEAYDPAQASKYITAATKAATILFNTTRSWNQDFRAELENQYGFDPDSPGKDLYGGSKANDLIKWLKSKGCELSYDPGSPIDFSLSMPDQDEPYEFNVLELVTQNESVAENDSPKQEILFYAKIPDGSKVYARVKDEEQWAKLQQQYRGAEIKSFDYRRPDILDWLEARGINLRKFAPGMVQTMYPGARGMTEGGEKDRQWSNKDMEKLRVATRDFDDILSAEGPDQTKHDLIKKRIKTKPMTGPKGQLPEQGVAEDYNGEYDDEAGMADNNLETLARAVEGIDDLIQSGDNLPEWCQEKIAVAKSMLVAVWDYMESEEESDEVDPEVDAMFEALEDLVLEMAQKNQVDAELVWESFEVLPDNVLYETAAWRRKEGKSKSGGLNAKGVASYRRENPGSKLQTAVTTKPSKLKPGSKAAKRRKSFCARMSGVKGPMKKPSGKPTRKALALRKWNC